MALYKLHCDAEVVGLGDREKKIFRDFPRKGHPSLLTALHAKAGLHMQLFLL